MHGSPPRRLPWWATCLLLLLLPGAARAAVPFGEAPFSLPPAELLAAAERVRGADPSPEDGWLLDETRYAVGRDGAASRVDRLIFRVRSEEHAHAMEAWYVEWFATTQDRPRLRARVVHPDGTVHELDPASVVEQPAEEGAPPDHPHRQLVAVLPDLVPGAVVEEVATYEVERPPLGTWFDRVLLLESRDHIHRLHVEISVPADLPFTWRIHASDATAVEEVRGDRRVLTVDDDSVDALPLPPRGSVREAPAYRRLEVSTAPDWATVRAAAAAAILPALDDPLPEEFLAPLRDLEGDARIVAAHRRVLEAMDLHSWANWSRPRGGEGAAAILARGVGDALDAAIVLAAALRQLGVEASPALARLGDDPGRGWEVPGLDALDGALVHLPDRDAWLLPGAWVIPPGDVEPQLYGRRALRLDPASPPGLTPLPTVGELPAHTRIEATIATDGGAGLTLRERLTYEGQHASTVRWYMGQDPASPPETQVRTRWFQLQLRDADIGVEGYEEVGAPLVIELAAAGPDLLSPRDGTWAISLVDHVEGAFAVQSALPASLWDPEDDSIGRATYDLLLRPMRWELHLRVEGSELLEVPREERRWSWSRGDLHLELASTLDGQDLQVVARCEVATRGDHRVTASDARAFHRALRAFADRYQDLIVLRDPVQSLRAEGRASEAMARLDRMLEADPARPELLARRADILAAAGLVEPAQADALAAAVTDPSDPLVAATLARGAFGVSYAPGWPRARAAEVAARALVEGDDRSAARRGLADVLLHPAGGGLDRDPDVARRVMELLLPTLDAEPGGTGLVVRSALLARDRSTLAAMASTDDPVGIAAGVLEAAMVGRVAEHLDAIAPQAADDEAFRSVFQGVGLALHTAIWSGAFPEVGRISATLEAAIGDDPFYAALREGAERAARRRPPRRARTAEQAARAWMWGTLAGRPLDHVLLPALASDPAWVAWATTAKRRASSLAAAYDSCCTPETLRFHAAILPLDIRRPRPGLARVVPGEPLVQLASGGMELLGDHAIYLAEGRRRWRVAALGAVPSTLVGRALEALEDGDLDTARWWARELAPLLPDPALQDDLEQRLSAASADPAELGILLRAAWAVLDPARVPPAALADRAPGGLVELLGGAWSLAWAGRPDDAARRLRAWSDAHPSAHALAWSAAAIEGAPPPEPPELWPGLAFLVRHAAPPSPDLHAALDGVDADVVGLRAALLAPLPDPAARDAVPEGLLEAVTDQGPAHVVFPGNARAVAEQDLLTAAAVLARAGDTDRAGDLLRVAWHQAWASPEDPGDWGVVLGLAAAALQRPELARTWLGPVAEHGHLPFWRDLARRALQELGDD